MNKHQALLIIDMQKGSFASTSTRFDSEGVVSRINEIAQLFRKLKLPVIYIQHDGTGSGYFEKNTADWEILDDLKVNATDIKIDKYANDVFYKSNLQAMLQKLEVTDIVITGCATDFCVESTVQSALTKEYHITIVSDGHTTGNRPGLTAEQVVNHYNWVWENMLPTEGSIKVESTEKLKASLAK